jgi:hypothetical protein
MAAVLLPARPPADPPCPALHLLVPTCRGLQSLVLEDVQCRLYSEPLAELGRLTQLTCLTVATTQRHGVYIFGLDSIPDTWRHLANLRCLELRWVGGRAGGCVL